MLTVALKIIAPVVLVATVATGGVTFARAAANTVTATKAGDGTGAVSGYTTSAETYTLNATDPTKVDSLDFTLNANTPAAGVTIKVRLDASTSTWYGCANTAGTAAVTCDFTGGTLPLVADIDQLQVVVAQ